MKNSKLKDVINEIQNDTLIEVDKLFDENYNIKKDKKMNSFFKLIIIKSLYKLLKPLKIRITILWGDKEIFTYEYPKN